MTEHPQVKAHLARGWVDVDVELKDYLEQMAQLGYTTNFSCQEASKSLYRLKTYYIQFAGVDTAQYFIKDHCMNPGFAVASFNWARDTSTVWSPWPGPGEELKVRTLQHQKIEWRIF